MPSLVQYGSRQVGAAAEDVVFADTGRQNLLFALAVALAQVDHAGGLFLHAVVDVDLVGRARDRIGLDVDVAEVAQAIDAVARGLDVLGVVPGRFLLAHFTAHDFIARTGVAADLDPAHINAAARVDVEPRPGSR
ncbi:hypothetical protein G6F35_016876 [Rhizopus arrhizus]|nr:hypothetical protein G6F35_016876 [Rhizopus arrhizus]